MVGFKPRTPYSHREKPLPIEYASTEIQTLDRPARSLVCIPTRLLISFFSMRNEKCVPFTWRPRKRWEENIKVGFKKQDVGDICVFHDGFIYLSHHKLLRDSSSLPASE